MGARPVAARTIVAAVGIAAVDVALLLVGLRSGWFTGGGLLVSVWAQSAMLVVAVPAVLFSAATAASDTPAVNAMLLQFAGQGRPSGDVPGAQDPGWLRGRTLTYLLAGFFVVHYGAFVLGIGLFLVTFAFTGVGLAGSLGAGVVLLVVRTMLANLPSVLADARFLREDGSSFLMARTVSVVAMAYRRMVPLHLGIIVLGVLDPRWWPYGVVAVIGTISFLGAAWPYPTRAQLAERSESPEAAPPRPPTPPAPPTPSPHLLPPPPPPPSGPQLG
ncbi:MAG: DUF6498-containing protein [Nitriliruptoraceae bacterium]